MGPYLSQPSICNTYKECGYSKDKPFVYKVNSTVNYSIVNTASRATFMMPDATVYQIVVGGGSSDNYDTDNNVTIDINGSKLPNMYGRDVFSFTRNTEQEAIIPLGHSASDSEVKENCKTKGLYCAELLRRNGWKITDDYPW